MERYLDTLSAEEKRSFAVSINEKFMNSDPRKALEYFLDGFPGRAALSSSLSYEDQTITDMMPGFSPLIPGVSSRRPTS